MFSKVNVVYYISIFVFFPLNKYNLTIWYNQRIGTRKAEFKDNVRTAT